MNAYWYRYAYVTEPRVWQERAVAVVEGRDSAFAVDALHGLGRLQLQRGELAAGMRHIEHALAIARRIGARSLEARQLNSLSIAKLDAGEVDAAIDYVRQSAAIAQEIGEAGRYGTALTNLAVALVYAGRFEEAAQASRQAIEVNGRLGDPWLVVIDRVNLVASLLLSSGAATAQSELVQHAAEAIALGDTELSVGVIELFACCRAGLGDAVSAALLLGCADEQRARAGIPRKLLDQRFVDEAIAGIERANLSAGQRDQAGREGAALSLGEALERALASVDAGMGQSLNQLPR